MWLRSTGKEAVRKPRWKWPTRNFKEILDLELTSDKLIKYYIFHSYNCMLKYRIIPRMTIIYKRCIVVLLSCIEDISNYWHLDLWGQNHLLFSQTKENILDQLLTESLHYLSLHITTFNRYFRRLLCEVYHFPYFFFFNFVLIEKVKMGINIVKWYIISIFIMLCT